MRKYDVLVRCRLVWFPSTDWIPVGFVTNPSRSKKECQTYLSMSMSLVSHYTDSRVFSVWVPVSTETGFTLDFSTPSSLIFGTSVSVRRSLTWKTSLFTFTLWHIWFFLRSRHWISELSGRFESHWIWDTLRRIRYSKGIEKKFLTSSEFGQRQGTLVSWKQFYRSPLL